jgi:YebC/PmpR family DNA-binding regulatory protein
MSGHSKWSSIKHKKAATDSKRGKLFTKLARAIQVSAREGGGDPESNASLALAVQKAKDASMPKDNIERAIAKGTGADQDGAAFEAVQYEGYGPGGVALLVDGLTDNRNRTGSEVRHLFSRHNGSLGEPGSVAWIFEKKGEIAVDASRYGEEDLMPAIDAGAEDVSADDGGVLEIVTAPEDLAAVRDALVEAGVELDSAELVQRPTTRTPVEDSDAATLMRLIEGLEDHDDVQAVHANFEMDAELLERVAAG